MGFAQENGYTPSTIDQIMLSIMTNVNLQFGTAYTVETFVGTNFYKYFYALAQRVQENEIKTSEIFLKLQQYFAVTNEVIQRPVMTPPGVIENMLTNGYTASVKEMILADAGKAYICVDVADGTHASGLCTITNVANLLNTTPDTVQVGATTFTAQSSAVAHGGATFRAATSTADTAISLADQINNHAVASLVVRAQAIAAVVHLTAVQGGTGGNSIALVYTDNHSDVGATVSASTLLGGLTDSTYAAKKLAINTIIKDSIAAGIMTQGTESSTIVLTNGQSFDFKFNVPNRRTTLLRLTTVLSENNQVVIDSTDDIKATLLANIAARYALGRNFEPQRYFGLVDAPWASSTLLEYSIDAGASYQSTVYDAAYDDLFEVTLGNISVVET